jgi:hypothetical protein
MRHGVCQWCGHLAVCQSSPTKPRSIKSRSNGSRKQAPVHSNGYDQLEGEWLLLPMVMIWLVDATLAYSYLRLERMQAVIFGAVMGVFTAPWLLPIVPYLFGWVG